MIEKYIRDNFVYNQYSGNLQRFDRDNSNGSIDAYGYLVLKIKGKQLKAHRIAWFLHYGSWPIGVIDHINGDRIDNRIRNLRDVSVKENNANNVNKLPNSKTGVKGVWLDSTNGLKKKFATKVDGKTYRFYTVEEANKFKQNAKQIQATI